MNAGMHAIGWGLPRLAIALGLTVCVILLVYATIVFVVVAGMAVTAMFP